MTIATCRSAPFEDAEHRLELGAELLDGSVASARRASGLSSPERRILLDLLARAFRSCISRCYSKCFTSMISSISRRWYTRLPERFLAGIQEAELTLPVAQHVRLQVGKLADLPDREELLNRLSRRAAAHQRSAFSSRSIRSLTA